MDENILMRKATPDDFETVLNIFGRAIENMISNGILQWDSLYPNEEILRKDILNSQMYLVEIDNKIASVFVLNQEYDDEYIAGEWKYREASFYVVHRLCVNPDFQGRGVGKITMQQIENYLREKSIETIRLDTFSLNPIALKLYEGLGYRKVGEVNWRKGLFYLFEKKI